MAQVRAGTFVEGLSFGEGPRWHEGRLWYSDFFTTSVLSVDESGAAPRRETVVAGRPSGLGWLPDGRLLAVSMLERAIVRREPDGRLERHADLAPWASGHANDLLVDGVGRAYVGNFGFDLEEFFLGRTEPAPTALLRVEPTGAVRVAAGDLVFPNGMVLLGRTLVVAETLAARLSAFDVADDGGLRRRRVWADLPRCAPDGICADASGAVWVADAASPECLRVEEGGTVTARVTTSQPCFACALGGADGRTLFCLTAPTAREGPRAATRLGLIERARVEVPGAAPGRTP